MIRIVLFVLFLALFAGSATAQRTAIHKVGGQMEKSLDAEGNPINSARPDTCIWNNSAYSGSWFSDVRSGYVYLDWGKLTDQGNNLPDEVIDGFKFTYGTNNMDPTGESFSVYFFDSCTGWKSLGVLEAEFSFYGLPNGSGLPPLPPGCGWAWTIAVDLEGSGDEFLLNHDFGHALSRWSIPTMGDTGFLIGLPGGFGGNDYTGTEDAYDVYYNLFPGSHLGTYDFGGLPLWATWPSELYGAQDPAWGMTYYGIGATGNNGALYVTGSFSVGGSVHFLLKRNGVYDPLYLGVSLGTTGGPSLPPATRLIGPLFSPPPFLMFPHDTGDFNVYDITPPPGSYTVYFQAGNVNPYLSNGIEGTVP